MPPACGCLCIILRFGQARRRDAEAFESQRVALETTITELRGMNEHVDRVGNVML
jgi:hypothetical protein